MRNNKTVVLIPYWIEDILKRNNLTIRDCVNFNKVRPLLSLNDLMGFVALQGFSSPVFFGRGSQVTDIINTWGKSIPRDQPETINYLYDTVAAPAFDPSIRNSVADRLFAKDNITFETPEYQRDSTGKKHTEPFAVHDLTLDTIGVVIYPGYFSLEGPNKYELDLVESVLQVLYANTQEGFHEIANTTLFGRYLELLSINR